MKALQTKLLIAALVAAGAAGFGWYRSQLAAAEARGRLADATAQLEKQAADFEAWRAERLRADSLRLQRIAGLEADLAATKVELTNARQVASEQRKRVAGVLAALPDSTRKPIVAALAATENEARVCSIGLGQCEEISAAKDRHIVSLDERLARTESLLEAERRVRKLAAGAGQGSNWLPWAIVGVESAVIVACLVGVCN